MNEKRPLPQSQVISGMTTAIMSDIRKLSDTAQAHAMASGIMRQSLEHILKICHSENPSIIEIEQLVNYALYGDEEDEAPPQF